MIQDKEGTSSTYKNSIAMSEKRTSNGKHNIIALVPVMMQKKNFLSSKKTFDIMGNFGAENNVK